MSKSKKKGRIRRLRILVKTIMTLLIIAIVVGGTGAFVYYCCGLKDVNSEGTALYSEAEIENMVRTGSYPDNTIYVFAKNKLQPITGVDFIDHFDVRISGLNSIQVNVVESAILGYLKLADGRYVYFDNDGMISAVTDRYVSGYLLISGVDCLEPANGQELNIGDRERYYLLTLTKLLEKYELTPLQLKYDSIGGITLCFENYDIKLGSNSCLEEKLIRLPYILPSIEGMNGTLHLENFSEENTDIVFEKAEESGE